MAKSLAQNTITFDGTGQEYEGWWLLDQVTLVKPSTAGDQAVLQDSAGNLITTLTASAANDDETRKFSGKWCNGIKCTTLGSGTLEIHVK